MAVIGFSVIRYVDPFQGGGILLENHREYKVQPELHTRCMANAGKKTGHMARFSVWQLLTQ
ncbi:hypothetical protein AAY86_03075 [Pseudomonas amygdali pv. tabaci str. ATCC 11528]|uniref:Uncharacterized protein n=2 Tax=Pseudomonas syringae group genomosp. 2 TaxID=251698 RepID=A0A0P9U2L1_9PSED|nr:hypothetical protein C1E_0228905 [Pseudomonas amygdali pv. tabaci str. ATCC 11528]KKY56681.1 hypothetical protein AAY85_16665 [Pseudomonas amygdali pv. lachrymans]KPX81428.1 Uncharacterized protein ALO64_04773 [Pseudomonas meliae]KWS37716.1 hypothetical protein AL060_23075 [Pseudomonas syringae pv. rhaphiolepidis]KKY55111.1 hypothetical protein AAY86_03075 [Pseudomonas amygdali pv. tabaci str. ATCC 11528]